MSTSEKAPVRGGAFFYASKRARCATRFVYDADSRGNHLGFRVVFETRKRNMCVVRGGAWRLDAEICCSECRSYWPPEFRNYLLGFRPVFDTCKRNNVVRVGSFDDTPELAGCAYRLDYDADDRYGYIGFRLVFDTRNHKRQEA